MARTALVRLPEHATLARRLGGHGPDDGRRDAPRRLTLASVSGEPDLVQDGITDKRRQDAEAEAIWLAQSASS